MISIFNPYAMGAFALAVVAASATAYTKGRIDGSDVAAIERLEGELRLARAEVDIERKAKAEVMRQAEAQRAIGEASAVGETVLAAAAAEAQERANEYAELLRREREERSKDATCPVGFALSPADVQWLRSLGERRSTAPAPDRPPDAPAGSGAVR